MDDLISRQVVLDAMYELCDTGENLKDNPWRDNPHIDAITDAINDLPSAENTGHWISINTGETSQIKDGMSIESVKCSVCDEWLTASDEYACNANFCPNCGARMRSAENGRT